MSSVPAVSILIPCRDAERYLEATIQSARSQTLPPVEILVVDDGSSDRSREIASCFPDVTVLIGEGRGASAARNQASRAARGDYFQYLDADDWLEPHAVAARVEALERTGGDVAISDWRRLVEGAAGWQEARIESGRLPPRPEPADLAVFRGFWAPPAAILYRRVVWERVGAWRETLPVIQDARFLLDAARLSAGFVHAPGVGASYRQHQQGSLSTGGTVRFWRDVLQNAREVEALWRESGQLDRTHEQVLADAYASCVREGASRDRALFEASRDELRRLGCTVPSRFVRAAFLLERFIGYRGMQTLLARFV